ncbi:MAG: Eco57I restriction-modification methylase domain-containing protein, partial [Isosphaeraceae bacterium]
EKQRDFARGVIESKISRAREGRLKIQNASEFEPYLKLDQELALVEEALDRPRFYGDLVVSAFFAGTNDRRRKDRLDELAETLAAHLANPDFIKLYPSLDAARNEIRSGEKPVTPFHWGIEFPEVFGRDDPGFDAVVGNPPFAGKNTMIGGSREGYLDWLKTIHEESHGNADLVAHFFRRAFDHLRKEGAFGLIATNTIGQGDTRSTGLRWICTHGGTIYAATRRKKWPGMAAVVVSVIHVGRHVGWAEPRRGEAHQDRRGIPVGLTPCATAFGPPYFLDDRRVPIITAYLFHAGGHDDPAKLKANEGKSFVGSYVLGMGFTFDDTDTKGVANPIALMHELIQKDPRNAERIFPYIGGEEVNDSPTHAHHRYVINFGEMSEDEARRWPDLMRIVEEKVKPDRAKLGGNRDAEIRKARWWLWGRYTPALFDAIRGLDRVLVISRVGQHGGFCFLPAGMVYSEQLIIFADGTCSLFSILQSRPHETWARFFASSLEDRLRYTPSDCFETFPFPETFETDPALEAVGSAYYEFRAALMVRNDEGLTKTYNRFHDPDELSPEILELRELHAAMDRAVLDAYGWTDLKPTCEFLLDYEEDEDEDESTGGRRRKKPWRYRWPDDFRDEVLARLLELNRQRAEEERLSGAAAEAGRGKTGKKSTAGRKADKKRPDQPELFGN